MNKKIKVCYRIAFDNGNEIYTSNSPGIAVPEFSVARRTSDEEAELNFEKYSYGEFVFEYGENDTIDVLVRELFKKMDYYYDSAFEYGPLPLFFMQDKTLYRIEDLSMNFMSLMDRLNIDKDNLLIYLIYCHQAGSVLPKEDGISYRMYSKEHGKHNIPHIHIEYDGYKEASISILNGTVLSGKAPKKVLKIVQKRIIDNQEYLLSCWNKLTDGISIDVEHFLKNKEILHRKFN